MIHLLFSLGQIIFISIALYYSFLTMRGLSFKLSHTDAPDLDYPDVDILIPAHNEGVVMAETLRAMTQLKYKGRLFVYVLNDNSTDNTRDIILSYAKYYNYIFCIDVPKGEPVGKSRVLNYGLSISKSPYFVVYDADNRPDPLAVHRLVQATLHHKNAIGAVGTVRTLNADHNLLTRMIAIEFQVFQLILQAGRWATSQVGSLPGTNMLLNRQKLEEVGGYDEYALAEDAELTIRITAHRYCIAIEPRAITWEQEPETLKVLIGQRTRWLQGNLYIMFKFFKTPSWWTPQCIHHLLHYLIVYVLFPVILLVSNVLFIAGLLGLVTIDFEMPFLFIWLFSYLIYTLQLLFAQWYDHTLSLKNIGVSMIMYFTYAQLFILLLFKGILGYVRMRKNKRIHWEKTSRVKID